MRCCWWRPKKLGSRGAGAAMGRTYQQSARAALATCTPWSSQGSPEKMPARSPLAWATRAPPPCSESNVRAGKPVGRLLEGRMAGPGQEGDQTPESGVAERGIEQGGLWEAGVGLECKPSLCLRRQAQPPRPPSVGRDVQGPKEHRPADLEAPRAGP